MHQQLYYYFKQLNISRITIHLRLSDSHLHTSDFVSFMKKTLKGNEFI